MACQLAVKVTPRAARNELIGWTDGSADASARELSVRVCAPPEGGKANKMVCELVAKSLGIAKGKVSVARGTASRHKMLSIDVDDARFESWRDGLEACAGDEA